MEPITLELNEKRESVRADGKSDKPWTKTEWPNDSHELTRNEKYVTRHTRKLWQLWWRSRVLERYCDPQLAPYRPDMGDGSWLSRGEFLRRRVQLEFGLAKNFIDPKRGFFILHKFKPSQRLQYEAMKKRRDYDLLYFSSIALESFRGKYANIETAQKDYINSENYFRNRKYVTKSKIPLKFRSYGSFINKLHTVPYTENLRRVYQDETGKWVAEDVTFESTDALGKTSVQTKMDPRQGFVQNSIPEISMKLHAKAKNPIPDIVKASYLEYNDDELSIPSVHAQFCGCGLSHCGRYHHRSGDSVSTAPSTDGTPL